MEGEVSITICGFRGPGDQKITTLQDFYTPERRSYYNGCGNVKLQLQDNNKWYGKIKLDNPINLEIPPWGSILVEFHGNAEKGFGSWNFNYGNIRSYNFVHNTLGKSKNILDAKFYTEEGNEYYWKMKIKEQYNEREQKNHFYIDTLTTSKSGHQFEFTMPINPNTSFVNMDFS